MLIARSSSAGRGRLRVGSEEEAVKLANDTPFGLGSYLFTTDPEQADRRGDKIEAGMVYVNIVGADGAELPFGGVKRSGWGRELGKYGADEFVNKVDPGRLTDRVAFDWRVSALPAQHLLDRRE